MQEAPGPVETQEPRSGARFSRSLGSPRVSNSDAQDGYASPSMCDQVHRSRSCLRFGV